MVTQHYATALLLKYHQRHCPHGERLMTRDGGTDQINNIVALNPVSKSPSL